jgi:hypothetical protein
MENHSKLNEDKVVRPRLNCWEIWTVYRLLDAEYWRVRRSGERGEYFMKLSRLRRKLIKDLNACRKDKISVKEKVG